MKPRLLLLTPHLVFTATALAARSTTPIVLGRFSKALFAFDAVNLAVLAAVIFASVRRRDALLAVALLGLLGLTFLGAMNNEIAAAPLSIPMMIASRFGVAIFFLAMALDAARAGESGASRARRLLLVGSSLLMFHAVDAAGVALFGGGGPMPRPGVFPFRSPVDLSRIEPGAVVFVGDSFVWGQGVAENEAFANRIGAALKPRPVYNLGMVGAGLGEYLAVMERVPPREVAVVCWFMNDMPPRETPGQRVRQAMLAMGRTSLVARLTSDLIGLKVYPDAAAYERAVIADYDKRDATFGARWKIAEAQLAGIAAEAKRGARERPILVILPLMTEYAAYPLREAHADLARAGSADGFEVIDMLPIFAEAFPHGAAYKVGPNDDHFNAEVHAKVADVIRGALARRAEQQEGTE